MVEFTAAVPYKLVDIGANLGHPSFARDFDDVIDRAKQAGLCKIMVTGTSVKHSREAKDLVKKYPGFLYFTAGVHPHDAKEFDDGSLAALRKLLGDEQCVAVGECGLDFNRNFSPPDVQKAVFELQVQLACELKKPMFIHEREASEDMLSILSKYQKDLPPVVLHCFTGTASEAQKYIEMGYYIGLTGFLWKDRSENGVKFALQNAVIPKERLLLETDAPFMYAKVNDKKIGADIRAGLSEDALQLHKFTSFNRNEPCGLAAICELIAAYMRVDPTALAEATTQNAIHIYGLQ